MQSASIQDPTVKVTLSLQGVGLFLVVARSRPVAEILKPFASRIVTPLGEQRALAMMELTTYLGLKNHPALQFIGPVNIDQARFNSFISRLSAVPTGVPA